MWHVFGVVLVATAPGCARGGSTAFESSADPSPEPDKGPSDTQEDGGAVTDDGATSNDMDATLREDAPTSMTGDDAQVVADTAVADTAPASSPAPLLSTITPSQGVVGSPGPTLVARPNAATLSVVRPPISASQRFAGRTSRCATPIACATASARN